MRCFIADSIVWRHEFIIFLIVGNAIYSCSVRINYLLIVDLVIDRLENEIAHIFRDSEFTFPETVPRQ